MNNYIQPGKTLTLTAPSGGVQSGKAYKIGQLVVVAAADAAQATPFEGHTEGVFDLPKLSAQAWTEGAIVYWDDANSRCTTSSATGLVLLGCAAAAAANPSDTGRVRLNGAAVLGVPP